MLLFYKSRTLFIAMSDSAWLRSNEKKYITLHLFFTRQDLWERYISCIFVSGCSLFEFRKVHITHKCQTPSIHTGENIKTPE